MRSPHHARLASLLLLLPAAAILFAGCTSTTSATTTGAASAAPTSSADFSAARDEYDLKLAACLREQGFDVADPQPGEGITETDPGIPEAVSACRDEIGDPPVSGDAPTDEEALQIYLKEVECFRSRGFEVEEPTLGSAYTLPENATQEDFDACLVS